MPRTIGIAHKVKYSSHERTQSERNAEVKNTSTKSLFHQGMGTADQAYLFIVACGLVEEFYELCHIHIVAPSEAHTALLATLHAQSTIKGTYNQE